ncbi:S16 family serine protease [Psittacicella gerlachiana]|uniref:Lon proteolytic domain-containing protein n=1 Tax=Psittacicella gerlachiana TaxID=2028574 RepID=A0A3A1YNB0_9GAMM|nr:S16 family serine protease [Psittacicella gerlachiana]RIY38460.1 hypothetical protein CKF59_00825 [Psittacicella gerlachiana]
MLKKLTPSELDIKLILNNYSNCLSEQSLAILQQLSQRTLSTALSNLVEEFFTYEIKSNSNLLADLDLDLTLKNPQAFTDPEQIIQLLNYKENNPQSELDLGYLNNYFLAKWLVFDNLEHKLADLISNKASILAIAQSSSLHSVQSHFFALLLNKITRVAFKHESFSPEQILQYKTNLARIEINSLTKVSDKNKATLTLSRERIEANLFSLIEIEDFSRANLFGVYNQKDTEQPYTPGLLALSNSIFTISASKLATNPELALELISTLSKKQFNLTQAHKLDLNSEVTPLSVATNSKLIILFNGQEQEFVHQLLNHIDKYQILGAYSYHHTKAEFISQAQKFNREFYLEAFTKQTQSFLQEQKNKDRLPDFVYQAENKQKFAPESLYLHIDMDQDLMQEIAYQLLFTLPQVSEQTREEKTYPNFSPTELIEHQIKAARKQKAKIIEVISQNTSLNKEELLQSEDFPLAHLQEVKQQYQEQFSPLKANKGFYLESLCRLVVLTQLLQSKSNLTLAYLNHLIEHLMRLNETTNVIYWSVDKLAYLLRRASDSQKLEQLLQSENVKQDTEYQAFLNYVLEDYQKIHTQGVKVGTANGLAFVEANEYTKDPQGIVFRLSSLAQGEAGATIDVDAEIELAGGLARRANIISISYLKSLFTDPLEFSATILTEQLYEQTDGDSATICSTIALASALSKIPVKQNFAVTGSMDQFGYLQAIGGVNQKIEAFYDLCKARGFTRNQGVIIPQINVKNLALREDLLMDLAQGNFFIYTASHISQVFELMTDCPFAFADDKTTLNQNDKKYQQAYFTPEESNHSFISAVLQNINGEEKAKQNWLHKLLPFLQK